METKRWNVCVKYIINKKSFELALTFRDFTVTCDVLKVSGSANLEHFQNTTKCIHVLTISYN